MRGREGYTPVRRGRPYIEHVPPPVAVGPTLSSSPQPSGENVLSPGLRMAHGTPVNILLVEDQPAHARLLRESLKTAPELLWTLHHVQYLHEAIAHVREQPTDVVLLDLGLPDSNGTDSVRRMHEAAPNVPIVVLTALDDERVALQAVHEGAQDYLDKSQLSGRILTRVIRYAIERARTDRELRRANERFRMAARAVNEIIYEWDLEAGTVERSEGLLRVLGI